MARKARTADVVSTRCGWATTRSSAGPRHRYRAAMTSWQRPIHIAAAVGAAQRALTSR